MDSVHKRALFIWYIPYCSLRLLLVSHRPLSKAALLMLYCCPYVVLMFPTIVVYNLLYAYHLLHIYTFDVCLMSKKMVIKIFKKKKKKIPKLIDHFFVRSIVFIILLSYNNFDVKTWTFDALFIKFEAFI